MLLTRQTRRATRHLRAGRLALLMPLLLTILAACGPGNGGGGPAY